MPFVILPTNSASGGYNITNSLRFNSSSSDKLSRSATSGSNTKYTVSCWVKRSGFDSSTTVFSTGDTSADNNARMLFINADNRVQVAYYNAGYTYQVETSALLRDPSAWYHLISAVDTTQATSSNRIKIYINGTLQTSLSTANYPTQNATFNYNSATQYIGDLGGRSIFSNFYLADFNYIDGQQLDSTSFGETDEDTGIWKPKAYTGTYGTNGFYLQFKNSASLGTDSSGNGNTFTVNNLTSIDQSTDTPTNNFTTLNPLTGIGTFSEGNLQYTTTTTDGQTSVNTISLSSGGKWYCEAKMISKTGGNYQLGISNTSAVNFTYRVLYRDDGQVYVGGTLTATYATFTTGDIIGMAFDSSTLNLSLYKNGTLQGTVTAPTLISSVSQDYFFGSVSLSGGQTFVTQWNFGSPIYSANSYQDANGFGNFSYSVPSGFYSLCTKNLSLYG